jgi:hypothetical protein
LFTFTVPAIVPMPSRVPAALTLTVAALAAVSPNVPFTRSVPPPMFAVPVNWAPAPFAPVSVRMPVPTLLAVPPPVNTPA